MVSNNGGVLISQIYYSKRLLEQKAIFSKSTSVELEKLKIKIVCDGVACTCMMRLTL